MKYINAAEVLPEKLLNEIFNYVDGELLYIPTSSRKRKWGELSGSREYYKKRNSEIINKYKDGEIIANEAIKELMRYCFEELGLKTLWCGYFDGNEKSLRAQEKCGFEYHHTNYEKPWPLMGDVRTEIITCITKAQWLNNIASCR